MARAVVEFNATFGAFDRADRANFEATLRRIYSPNTPEGAGAVLSHVAPVPFGAYARTHDSFHRWFHLIATLKGYHDVFLVTPQGDVVYTAMKEVDFAANLYTDAWRDTGLAKAFVRSLRTSDAEPDVFEDYDFYAPSAGKPAAFVARRIFLDGRVVGVVVMQMPISRINAIMQEATALGTSGETYLIGEDGLMRSDSRIADESTLLRVRIDPETVRRGQLGESGVRESVNYRGEPVLSAYAPFLFMGVRWNILAERNLAEIAEPIAELRRHAIHVGLVAGALVIAIGFAAARMITAPLGRLTRQFHEFGTTHHWRTSELESRRDEIGVMARDVAEIAQQLDATMRKVADNEKWFRSLMESTPDATLILDGDGIIYLVNRQCELLFGFSKQELIGESAETLVPSGLRALHGQVSTESGDGGRLVGRRKAGDEFPIEISFSPINTSEGLLMAVSIRDITARERAERKLRKSRREIEEKSALLQAVLDSMDQGLAAFDRELKLVAWNFKFLEIRGYPLELGETGRPFADFMRFDISRNEFAEHGDDPEAVFQFMIERARKFEHHSFERLRPDGRYIEVKGGPMPGGGFVSTYTDVTARKRAEIGLAEKERQLQSALDNMSGGIFMVDADFNIVLANDKFREFYDVSPRLIVPGQPFRRVLEARAKRGEYGDGDAAELVEARVQNYLSDPESRVEDTVAGGRILEVHRAKTSDGGIIGIVNDITDRKAADIEIARHNATLQRISDQLSRYLSPQVYEQIIYGQRSVELTTERKKLTVFFSDIKDFTATTDDMEPEDLTFLLNDYLTEMSVIALEFGATIDKYVGDAMLMFFGDPETKGVREDALTCVRMAVAMQRYMVALREKWAGMGYEKAFHMRIGINTGYCNVGNFGSDQRMDYTIIGGEVNLAARLESAFEPDGVMLSQETYLLVRDHFKAVAKDPIHVKGIHREITPYQVAGIHENVETEDRFIRREVEGLRLFVDMKYLGAQDRRTTAEQLEEIVRRLREGAGKSAADD